VAAVVRVIVSIVTLLPFVLLHGAVAAVRAQSVAALGAGAGGRRITFLAGVAAAVAAALIATLFVTAVTRLDIPVVAFLLPHGDAVAARRLGRLDTTPIVTAIARIAVSIVTGFTRGAPAVAAVGPRTAFAACAPALVSRTGVAARAELSSRVLAAGDERPGDDGGHE
jgi:hypothetical protein